MLVLLELSFLPGGRIDVELVNVDVSGEQEPGAEGLFVWEGLKLVVVEVEFEAFEVDDVSQAAGGGEVYGLGVLEMDGEILAVDVRVVRIEIEGVVDDFYFFTVKISLLIPDHC